MLSTHLAGPGLYFECIFAFLNVFAYFCLFLRVFFVYFSLLVFSHILHVFSHILHVFSHILHVFLRIFACFSHIDVFLYHLLRFSVFFKFLGGLGLQNTVFFKFFGSTLPPKILGEV